MTMILISSPCIVFNSNIRIILFCGIIGGVNLIRPGLSGLWVTALWKIQFKVLDQNSFLQRQEIFKTLELAADQRQTIKNLIRECYGRGRGFMHHKVGWFVCLSKIQILIIGFFDFMSNQ